MKEHIVKIKSIEHVTHDVLQIIIEKPAGFNFTPGQATEIAINKEAWQNEGKPFTFTSLPDDDHLEFTIKTYPERKCVTNELLTLKAGDELILRDIFGAIEYKGEGIFIAGGAGVTPFISIFRNLKSKNETGNNKLVFANKTKADIIHEKEFKDLLGKNFINILSQEKTNEYAYGLITQDFLKANINGPGKKIYICGPPPMMEAVELYLANLHVPEQDIVKEEF
ncbi:MAG TPA: flavodoxin reductase [Ginsengibacter sp.]